MNDRLRDLTNEPDYTTIGYVMGVSDRDILARFQQDERVHGAKLALREVLKEIEEVTFAEMKKRIGTAASAIILDLGAELERRVEGMLDD